MRLRKASMLRLPHRSQVFLRFLVIRALCSLPVVCWMLTGRRLGAQLAGQPQAEPASEFVHAGKEHGAPAMCAGALAWVIYADSTVRG